MYQGNLKFFKEQRHFLIGFISILLLGGLVMFAVILSFVDIFFHMTIFLRLFMLLFSICITLLILYFLLLKIDKFTIEKLTAIYRKSNIGFQYSPRVLLDIEQGNVHHQSTTDDEHILQNWQRGLHHFDFSLVKRMGIPGLLKANINKNWFFMPVILVVFVLTELFMGINPLRIFRLTTTDLIPASAYSMVPQGGTFFYGQKLEINVRVKTRKYQFIGFEFSDLSKKEKFKLVKHLPVFKKTNNNQVSYSLTIPALVDSFSYRAVFSKGLEKLYSKKYKIKVRLPVFFKEIKFIIYPPAYTHLPVYTTSENLLRIFYGSRIKASVTLNADKTVFMNNLLLTQVNKTEMFSIYQRSFLFLKFNETKYQFVIKDQLDDMHHDIKSPVYEMLPAEDKSPTVQILSRTDKIEPLKLPESGTLEWTFQIQDDFSLQDVSVYVLVDDKVILQKKISIAALKKSSSDDTRNWRGKVSLDLSAIKAREFVNSENYSLS